MPEIRISIPEGVNPYVFCQVRKRHLFPPDKEHEFFIDPAKPHTAVCTVTCLLCGTVRTERIYAYGRGRAVRIGHHSYDHPEGYSSWRERLDDHDELRAQLVVVHERREGRRTSQRLRRVG